MAAFQAVTPVVILKRQQGYLAGSHERSQHAAPQGM